MTSSRRAAKPAVAPTAAPATPPPRTAAAARTAPNTVNARTGTRNPSITIGTLAKILITIVALAAVAYVAWLLVTSAGLGTFPVPADDASDAAKVGAFMIRFGLVIIALAVAVLLGTQILGVLLPKPDGQRTTFSWIEFMKALGELIKTPAGIGFGVVILGIILMFPTVFATPPN